jgi:predicted RNA-binding protein with PUA-like domain
MHHWLIKFAPFRTNWSEIVKRGVFTLRGVRNHQARNHLSQMQLRDPVLFYQSQRQQAVVGLMEVMRPAYPDPTSSDPRWLTCDFVPLKQLSRPVPLADIKLDPDLQEIALIRQPRLAVMPLTGAAFSCVIRLSLTEKTHLV